MTTTARGKKPTHTLVSQAFSRDAAPAQLSAAIVSLVELCQRAMPDPKKIRKALVDEAKFVTGKQAQADEMGGMIALDSKIIGAPVTGLRHELFGRERTEEPVIILLSVGKSEGKEVVFLTAAFRGAIEADVVKAVTHVTKKKPFGGGRTQNVNGELTRRVFWDVEGEAGVRGMVAWGPDNVEETRVLRGVTAFNRAGVKK